MSAGANSLLTFANRNKKILLPLLALAALGIFFLARPLFGGRRQDQKEPKGALAESGGETDENGAPLKLTVRTVRGRNDPTFIREVTSPAYIEAFYKIDLYARVSGKVVFIEKNIGDRVSAGEVLIEIDDPELALDVIQKEVLLLQAGKERDAAMSREEVMKEAMGSARNHWEEKKTAREQALAIRDLRQDELKRYRYLASKEAVTPDLVEERIKDVRIAESSVKAAELAIQTAESEFREYRAKVGEAKADIQVKEARVSVATKAKEKAEALADLTKVRAPFNGTIIARYVDPGAFVQNATTARTTPMLSLMRSDVVTVSTMVPERLAHFVRLDTQAEIRVEVEGEPIEGLRSRVTRFARYLDSEKGRTMRVEVDLLNPTSSDFREAVNRAALTFVTPLAADNCLSVLTNSVAAAGEQSAPGLLEPGMYGSMRLLLQDFEGPNIVPNSVLVMRGGKTYVYVVKDGRAQERQVRVLIDDGARSRIAFLRPRSGGRAGADLERLAGTEEIVASGLNEISDGMEVQTVSSK